MPSVASDIDGVCAGKDEGLKCQDETVTKCPFEHSKHSEDVVSDVGVERNGNNENGKLQMSDVHGMAFSSVG